MSRKKKAIKTENSLFYKILLFLLAALVCYSAITLGMIMGNILYNHNFTISDLMINVNVDSLKEVLNKTFPIIETVYNSGKISVSLTSEINALIRDLFSFDINKPATILNAEIPILYSYYMGKLSDDTKITHDDSNTTQNQENFSTPKPTDDNKGDENTDITNDYFIERISSISIEDETEDREYTENEVVSKGEIKVINETSYSIDDTLIEKLYNEKLNIDFSNNSPTVLIFHTHTNEAYLNNLSEYNTGKPNRNDDPRYNVVRVGEEIARHLRKMGIGVIHNGTRHNYPTDNGCYVRSMDTVSTILKSYPSIKLVIDIHRDGVDEDKPQLRLVSEVNGEKLAQVMFVVGTGEIGLSHPNWTENFKLAIHMQNWLNTKYPGITRPIFLSKYRYNHHLSPGSIIIEVGADGNTLTEALNSTKYIAEAIRYIVNK